jgi:transposase
LADFIGILARGARIVFSTVSVGNRLGAIKMPARERRHYTRGRLAQLQAAARYFSGLSSADVCCAVSFSRLKDFRLIATRYDKLARNFLAGVLIAATLALVAQFESAP